MIVAFIASGLGRGGAERQLCQLATGLKARGHEIHVAAVRDGPQRPLLEAAGISVAAFEARTALGGVGARLRLARAIRAIDPEIVHPYLTSTNTWVTWLRPLMGRRLIVWGVRDSGTDPNLYGLRARIAFAAARRASRRADLIVANSEAGARNYAALGYPAARTIVIPNGIDTDVFRQRPEARASMRGVIGVGPGEVVVGMLARFDPVKGHDDFVAAAGTAVRSTPLPLRFVIAGDHPDEERTRLMRAAAASGVRLTILPAQERPQDVLNAFDVLVMPSRLAEGFPNVIGEALSCGLQVVATDVGDSRMLVEGRGEVVPPSRPDLLAVAMVRLASTAGRGGDGADRRAFVVDNYSIDELVSRTEAALVALIDGGEQIPGRVGP